MNEKLLAKRCPSCDGALTDWGRGWFWCPAEGATVTTVPAATTVAYGSRRLLGAVLRLAAAAWKRVA